MRLCGLDVFGDDSPALPKSIMPTEKQQHRWRGFLLGLMGSGAGAFLWPKHRILGGFGGFVLGRDGYRLLAHEGSRTSSIVRLGEAGSAIAGALFLPLTPALGFAVGAIGGAVVASFVGDGDE